MSADRLFSFSIRTHRVPFDIQWLAATSSACATERKVSESAETVPLSADGHHAFNIRLPDKQFFEHRQWRLAVARLKKKNNGNNVADHAVTLAYAFVVAEYVNGGGGEERPRKYLTPISLYAS
jgi:hypothetical protein